MHHINLETCMANKNIDICFMQNIHEDIFMTLEVHMQLFCFVNESPDTLLAFLLKCEK